MLAHVVLSRQFFRADTVLVLRTEFSLSTSLQLEQKWHVRQVYTYMIIYMGFPGASGVKNLPAMQELW